MIKAIAFDLMGVVFKEPHIITDLLFPLLVSAGKNNVEYGFLKDHYNKHTAGLINSDEFWNGVIKGDYRSFEKKYLDLLVLDKDFEEVIDYLSSRYRLGIISDLAKEWADYLISKFSFRKIFDPIIISGYEGVMKPDPRLFIRFQELSGTPFDQILFIDDRKKNLEAAKKLGMRTAWFKRENDSRSSFVPDHVITSLKDLKQIL